MIFTADPKGLKEALDTINSCLTEKLETVDSIFAFIKFEGKADGKITVTGSGIRASIKCEFDGLCQPGGFEILLPYKQMYALSKLATSEVHVMHSVKKAGFAELNFGKSRNILPTRPVNEFPAYMDNFDPLITLPVEVFKEMVATCSIAASKQDRSAWTLRSLCLQGEGQAFKMSALDGTQFACSRYGIETEPFKVLIPGQAIQSILKICTKAEDDIKIEYNSNRVQCTTTRGVLQEGLIVGDHPDLESKLPTEFTHSFMVTKDDLFTAIKLAQVTSKSNVMEVNLGDEQLIMRSRDATLGYGQQVIDVDITSDDRELLKFGFITAHLVALLTVISGNLIFQFNKDPRMMMLKITPEHNALKYYYIAMSAVVP